MERIILTFLLTLACTYIGTNKALALEQTVQDSYIDLTNGVYGLAQTFAGADLPSSLSDLTFKLHGTDNKNYFLKGNSFLQDLSTGTHYHPDLVDGKGHGDYGTITSTDLNAHWNTPVSITSGHNYKFVWVEGNTGYKLGIYGSATSNYSGGRASWNTTSQYHGCTNDGYAVECATTGNPADLTFTTSSTFTEPTVITFITPSTSTTSDFASWVIETSNVATTTSPSLCVEYSGDSFSGSREDCYPVVLTDDGGQYGWAKSLPLTNGDYFATTTLKTSTGTLITSATTTWTIELSGLSGAPIVDCGGGDWSATTTLCNVLVYLFLPSSESLTYFQSNWSDLKTKSPFGYQELFLASLEDITASGTASFTPSGAIKTYIFDPFSTAISIICWVACALSLYKIISLLLHKQ